MIEKSILELNQLFVEMATLVEQQGDLVNQIESHVDKAAQYTEQAAGEMKVALQHQKSRLKVTLVSHAQTNARDTQYVMCLVSYIVIEKMVSILFDSIDTGGSCGCYILFSH